MADVWLSWWADSRETTVPSGLRGHSDRWWGWTLGLWVAGTLVVAVLRSIWSVNQTLRASEMVHARVLSRVFTAVRVVGVPYLLRLSVLLSVLLILTPAFSIRLSLSLFCLSALGVFPAEPVGSPAQPLVHRLASGGLASA